MAVDDPRGQQASVAWNKLLMVQLDILQAGYINEVPTEAAGEARDMPEVK